MTNRRTFLKQASLLATAPAAAALARAQSATSYVVAETKFGKLRGEEVRGIKIFKGVPYGASTAGQNRFMPPKDPERWGGVRDALHYGASTPQTDWGALNGVVGRPGASANSPAESEDCLVLNVWTPALNDGRKRPVLFWCHGGGFVSGSGSSPGYDGTNLAHRGDVVVVTVNHRLNVLGFTYLAEFGGSEFASSGDAGMLDLVHALGWVQENIEQFGGDPNTVMIFGQSGGGRKVGTLLAMPAAKGMFHRAVIESGPTIKLVEREQAIRVAGMLLAKLNISKTEVRQLQRMPVERIMGAYFAVLKEMAGQDQMTQGFSPTVDGSAIPHHPFHPTASPISADVPLMLGHTRTEYTLFSERDSAAFSLDDAAMRERIKKLAGRSSEALIETYRKVNPGASPSDLYFLIESDYRYGAPVMKIAERRAALGKGPVHLYYFTWETPVQGGRLKSPHTIEIPFAFDNVEVSRQITGGGADAMALADKVSDTWIEFARKGDPNTPKLPHWPAFNAKDRPTMVINNQSKVVDDPLHAQRIAMFRALDLA
ncbi:MAG TPA: carboxylesterase family protein [Bryobacteraceae bacterium]|nr:carboxylesterase family protein [Bryobacteraceae bacterium]